MSDLNSSVVSEEEQQYCHSSKSSKQMIVRRGRRLKEEHSTHSEYKYLTLLQCVVLVKACTAEKNWS